LERLQAWLATREQDQDVPGLLNAGIENLLKLDKAFSENEKGQSGKIPALSSQVDLAGQDSNPHQSGFEEFNWFCFG